jgi:hypothetical protein
LRDARASHLINAYSLYLAAIHLRRNTTATGELYQNEHSTIEEGLRLARYSCGAVEPKEMSAVLTRAVDEELASVHNGDYLRI